ncbi:hypothetical protein EV643_109166 [Kribbella sp. VKM Ac-2527]|uniref:Uncharacterized protein n=1 Tax=Kribbella caucasensis TaxID=2512215 RepID=A0A4R6KE11_9ACTN|nr:hypothetical protein [Kribbella sp. VKM Ac-2527]TDO47273.1 hypothetical protein EV643_109166 [Kribbella sp. VKM Ac-2527]
MHARKKSVVAVARKAPGTAARAATVGSQYERVLALQQTVGNRAVSIALRGGPVSVNLHGETSGSYDGGTSVVSKPKIVRAKGCDCSDEDPCLRATGTIAVTYHVDVTIRMPDMPEGLSDCQQRRVRSFLRDVLGPHEQEHARRLRTYNGITNRKYSITGCGRAGLESEMSTKLQDMHNDEATARADAADKSSAAIDPFVRPIDLNC